MQKKLTTLDILRDARNSGLFRKAAQSLYYHLALRADQSKQYSTYVGYPTLCADTGLDAKTLQKAAAELEDQGLIRRVVRPNHSNIWFLNVTAVRDAVERIRENDVESPFRQPDIEGAEV
ncbi:MAG: helix-turn-helix domain-containing protein [Acidobacteriaceae bacterium]|nr:helix-turn-helix domain-containing protein [Acidobacteriaceae bacterium]